VFKIKTGISVLMVLALAGCASDGELVPEGIIVTRSACPSVAIPAATGDVTLFNPADSRDASAIDVVAAITNVRMVCDETGEYIVSNVTFDVQARRSDPHGRREVILPYFSSVVQGGDNVVAKRLGRVSLIFADGEYRASTSGAATGQVLRSAATLPEDVREQINRKRKPGDPDAAIDPMAIPAVRAAVTRASFELLVGFQLSEEQLRYNVTR
jgi:hypothetical protein